jgi:hypothetical protein
MFGHADIDIQTEIKTKTTVNVNWHNLDEVLDLAVEMAHTFLEGASRLRAKGKLKEYEDVLGEGMACRFLDMVGD